MPPSQPKLRLKDRRRRLAWVKVAAGSSVVVIVLALMFYVARLPQTTIGTVAVSGTTLIPADSVKSLAEENLSGSYAYLIPHRNAFLAPTGTIAAAVMKAFPEAASVSVTRPDLHTLAVAVTERTPAGLWCSGTPEAAITNEDGSAPENASEGTCYRMDDGGFIFATGTPEMAFVKYFGGISGEPIRATYLSGDFSTLNKTVSGIAAYIKQNPMEVAAENSGTDVSVAFDSGGVVRFTRSASRDAVLQNVASVFASQSFKDHPDFEYVDFRFGDKVYVKFK